jgi:hypothetical protein
LHLLQVPTLKYWFQNHDPFCLLINRKQPFKIWKVLCVWVKMFKKKPKQHNCNTGLWWLWWKLMSQNLLSLVKTIYGTSLHSDKVTVLHSLIHGNFGLWFDSAQSLSQSQDFLLYAYCDRSNTTFNLYYPGLNLLHVLLT